MKTRALFFTLGDEGAALKDGLGQLSSALGKTRSKGLRWASAVYPDENHGSVVLRSHYAALRSYQKAEELGTKNGDPNAGVFKANAERVRVKLLEKTRERAVRP